MLHLSQLFVIRVDCIQNCWKDKISLCLQHSNTIIIYPMILVILILVLTCLESLMGFCRLMTTTLFALAWRSRSRVLAGLSSDYEPQYILVYTK
jgi:hypothetical protein